MTKPRRLNDTAALPVDPGRADWEKDRMMAAEMGLFTTGERVKISPTVGANKLPNVNNRVARCYRDGFREANVGEARNAKKWLP